MFCGEFTVFETIASCPRWTFEMQLLLASNWPQSTVGIKRRVTAHELLAVIEPPQLSLSLKSVEGVIVTVAVAVPWLVNVKTTGALVPPTTRLPKFTLDIGIRRLGAPAKAVPERLMVWGLSEALSVRIRVADRDPAVVGTKFSGIEQLPPATTVVQVLPLITKSPGFVPLLETFENESAVFPRLMMPRT